MKTFQIIEKFFEIVYLVNQIIIFIQKHFHIDIVYLFFFLFFFKHLFSFQEYLSQQMN